MSTAASLARVEAAAELRQLAAARDIVATPAGTDYGDDDYEPSQQSDDGDGSVVFPFFGADRPSGTLAQRARRSAAQRGDGNHFDRLYESGAPGADGAPPVLDSGPQFVRAPGYERAQLELGDGGGPDQCFCCRMVRDGERVAPVCRDAMRRIMEAVDTCVSPDPVRLAQDLALAYERYVRAPANAARRDAELECPAWSAASIYEHFFTPRHGRLDAIASLRRRVRYLEEACHDIECHGIYVEERGADGVPYRLPDTQRLRELRATYRDLDRLYAINPSKLLFAGSNVGTLQHASAMPARPMYGSLPPSRGRRAP